MDKPVQAELRQPLSRRLALSGLLAEATAYRLIILRRTPVAPATRYNHIGKEHDPLFPLSISPRGDRLELKQIRQGYSP